MDEKILKLSKSNTKPAVNSFAIDQLAWSVRKGLLWAKTQDVDGSEQVVCIGQAIVPGIQHARQHAMDNPLDHAPSAPGMYPVTDANGNWILTPKPEGIGGSGLIIPELILFKEDGKLYAKWNSFDVSFLAYNPKVRLFRHSKNSKRDKPDKIYFNRLSSVKMRLITRFSGIIKKIEWDCPTTANTRVEIDIDLNDWIIDKYEDSEYIGVYISRKSRSKLFLSIFDQTVMPEYQAQIAVTFGLGIVIDNPDVGETPLKLWNKVTAFKIGAQKITYGIGTSILKGIRLR